tara:strand:- start:1410 stop:1706 length:297 start_codon:yes stop_codon:yes gene_type:complete
MDIPLLITVFTTVFLAELGDKTQLATLALTGSTDKPLAVFLGSASALILASLLGAIAGGSISEIIPESLLKAFASIGFLYIGSTIAWLSVKSEKTNLD